MTAPPAGPARWFAAPGAERIPFASPADIVLASAAKVEGSAAEDEGSAAEVVIGAVLGAVCWGGAVRG